MKLQGPLMAPPSTEKSHLWFTGGLGERQWRRPSPMKEPGDTVGKYEGPERTDGVLWTFDGSSAEGGWWQEGGRWSRGARARSKVHASRTCLLLFPFDRAERWGTEGGASLKTQWQRQLHAEAAEDILNEQRQPVAAPLHHLSSTHTRCIPYVTRTVNAHLAQHNLFIYSM